MYSQFMMHGQKNIKSLCLVVETIITTLFPFFFSCASSVEFPSTL